MQYIYRFSFLSVIGPNIISLSKQSLHLEPTFVPFKRNTEMSELEVLFQNQDGDVQTKVEISIETNSFAAEIVLVLLGTKSDAQDYAVLSLLVLILILCNVAKFTC